VPSLGRSWAALWYRRFRFVAYTSWIVADTADRHDTVRHPFVRLERSMHTHNDQKGTRFHTAVVGVRVRHIARYTTRNGQSILDLTGVRAMDVSFPDGGGDDNNSRLEASPATEAIEKGIFSCWYEASVSSAKAEAIFAENETLAIGDESRWDVGTLTVAGVLEAVYKPALEMIRQMDGVGAKVDNGQGSKLQAPGWNIRQVEALREAEGLDEEFW